MGATLIPVLRYRDAPKAIDWLVEAFGFERHLVIPGEVGEITHAQLVLGSGMMMLGTARDDDPMPAPAQGRPTGFYVIVDDVDAHAARAQAAGAKIVTEPYDEYYGGRAYTCLDPEGYEWSFGSYDPWTAHSEA